MENDRVIITDAEFFKISYQPTAAKVAPRGFSSLTFRLSGRVEIFTTDRSVFSQKGSLTFVPAGCSYITRVHEGGEMLVMHYRLCNETRDFADRPMSAAVQSKDVFINQFTNAIRHFQSERASYACMADAYRLLFDARSVFFPSPSSPLPYKRLAELKGYVDTNLHNRDLRISALAARFGTSEVYFRKEFKRFYGQTPIEYIKAQRLELACQLLKTGLYSITEVATSAGFDSISYFSAEFHRKFGCSPREYQKL